MPSIREWLIPPAPPESSRAPTLDDIRQQVRQVELQARRALREALAGEYRSALRGRGLEFAELQPYRPGDDVRAIDWKATARLPAPVVRRYVEEREQTVLLLVDVSASMHYAASGVSVRDRAIEIAGALGLAAAAANDKVGAAAFAARVTLAAPPAKGSAHILRLIRALLTAPAAGRTELARALRYADLVMRQRGVVIIISDFHKTHPDHSWEAPLSRLARRHDVIAICLRDPQATRLENGGGIVHWGGAERGDSLQTDQPLGKLQAAALKAEEEQIQQQLQQCGCDAALIPTTEPWPPHLRRLLHHHRP